MMKDDMCIVNEEYGELTYSILSRLVLGDHIKSDFEHMNKMFSMIPMYTGIRDDIFSDFGKAGSLNWRHVIKPEDECVAHAVVFFKRLIREVVDDTYKSYNGKPDSFKNAKKASENLTTEHIPLVYDPRVVDTIIPMFDSIRKKLSCPYLTKPDVKDIWPEAVGGVNHDLDMSDDSDAESELSLGDDQEWGAPWRQCKPDKLAVTACDFPVDGLGIGVYKVSVVHPPVVTEDEVVRMFEGRQLQCNLKNTRKECINGLWKTSNIRTKDEQVLDWEVIIYFEKLLPTGHLPPKVLEKLKMHMKENPLFQDQLEDAHAEQKE